VVINPQHFTEVRNGRQQTTDGLWLHRGRLMLKDTTSTTDIISLGGSQGFSQFNQSLFVNAMQPRIWAGGWQDAHLRIDQTAPSEPRIGFHEAGNSALALYKQSGTERLRVRTNTGADWEVAGAPGSGQAFLGNFRGLVGVGYYVPAGGAWYESTAQVNATTSGGRIRLEASGGLKSNTAGAVVYIGFGIDGAIALDSQTAGTIPVAGYTLPFGCTGYVQPAAGPHRFAIFVYANVANNSGLEPGIYTNLWVHEQKI
jgi:hypothetical protein